MRYQDWDVILFPKLGARNVPSKEFQVSCQAAPETERSLVRHHGPIKIPVMHCYVPLEAGAPFTVSIQSWSVPEISDLAKQSYPAHAELVKSKFRIQVRVLIDGQEVKSLGFKPDCGWPKLIPEKNDQSNPRELELLRFPHFRPHMLGQRQSSPADPFGRIQVIISEGFQREMPGEPVDRFQNLVIFSFQYQPLELLENQGIAWPNPAMWNEPAAAVAAVPVAETEPFPAYQDPFAGDSGQGWSAQAAAGSGQFNDFSLPQQDEAPMHLTGASYNQDPSSFLNFQINAPTAGTGGDFLATGQFTFRSGASQDYATGFNPTLQDQHVGDQVAVDSPMSVFFNEGYPQPQAAESGYDFGFGDTAAASYSGQGFDATSGFDFAYGGEGVSFGGLLQQDEASGYAGFGSANTVNPSSGYEFGFGGDVTAGSYGTPLQEMSSNAGAGGSMGPPARVAGVKRARTYEEDEDEE